MEMPHLLLNDCSISCLLFIDSIRRSGFAIEPLGWIHGFFHVYSVLIICVAPLDLDMGLLFDIEPLSGFGSRLRQGLASLRPGMAGAAVYRGGRILNPGCARKLVNVLDWMQMPSVMQPPLQLRIFAW